MVVCKLDKLIRKQNVCNGFRFNGAQDHFGQVVLNRALPEVATLKAREGAFDALNQGSGALEKVKSSCHPPGSAL